MRDKIVIASKVGFIKHGGPQDFSADHIKKSVEGSLKRLGTDYIDLYQLHSPPIEDILENREAVTALHSLKDQGLIKAIGISVKNPGDGLRAISDLGFQSVQVNFNMIDQRALENGLFELALKNGAGIIARTPLAFGFLSGKIMDLNFDSQDHRSSWPKEQLQRWADAPNLFSFVNKGKSRTPVQLALRFCLSFDAVATVIPGMMSCEEVVENAKASEVEPLDENELKEIDQVYKNNTFFDKNIKQENK